MLIILTLSTLSCATAVPEETEKPVTEQQDIIQAVPGEEDNGVEEKTEEQPAPDPQPQEQPTPDPQPQEQPAQDPQPQEQPAPDPQPQEQPTPDPQPQEQPLPEPQPIPEEPEVADHKYQELALFVLDLINQDRIENGLNPLVMGGNSASQIHAEENLANGYSSHWGMDGLKPYMRYTLAGGVNYVGENVFGTGTSDGPSENRDPGELLKQAQERFMDSPSHRANILNRWHKKVSLGIAYDNENLNLVQHFEGNYIGFSQVPAISGTTLSMAGKLKTGNFEQLAIHYDPLPQALSPQQLDAPPYDSSYSLGGLLGNILPPPPPGSNYVNLSPIDFIATTWDIRSEGWFIIKADISQILEQGTGVYTVVVVANIGGEFIPVSNYSIFVR